MFVSKLFRAYRLYNAVLDKAAIEEIGVSKLFRAYRLYNDKLMDLADVEILFQSSFELTGYITVMILCMNLSLQFQSSFELTGYITYALWKVHEY